VKVVVLVDGLLHIPTAQQQQQQQQQQEQQHAPKCQHWKLQNTWSQVSGLLDTLYCCRGHHNVTLLFHGCTVLHQRNLQFPFQPAMLQAL
jgi:hypothetical protein